MTHIPAGWKPIESAPKNQLVMVYTPPQPSDWPDTVRISFDYIDPEVADDYWYNHGEHYEHYCCVAKPENCTGPQERAPYTHWMPLPAAPGSTSSAPGDAQDERQAFEAWAKKKKMPLARIGQQYDDFWVDHAWNGWQARARLSAPAAGDARAVAVLAELVACDNLKRQLASMQACAFVETDAEFEEMDRIMSDLTRRQPAAWDAARAVVAASQQQEG